MQEECPQQPRRHLVCLLVCPTLSSITILRTPKSTGPALSALCHNFSGDSFFSDSIQDSSIDCIPDTLTSTTSLSPQSSSPIEWYSENIRNYYKKNLTIGHLNTNSILGKIDEILELLHECRFYILVISETKIDNFVSTSLLSNPHYCITRNDRKKGAGGLLVYIHNSIKARRRPKLNLNLLELNLSV